VGELLGPTFTCTRCGRVKEGRSTARLCSACVVARNEQRLYTIMTMRACGMSIDEIAVQEKVSRARAQQLVDGAHRRFLCYEYGQDVSVSLDIARIYPPGLLLKCRHDDGHCCYTHTINSMEELLRHEEEVRTRSNKRVPVIRGSLA